MKQDSTNHKREELFEKTKEIFKSLKNASIETFWDELALLEGYTRRDIVEMSAMGFFILNQQMKELKKLVEQLDI